jgi:transposase InsO family protein
VKKIRSDNGSEFKNLQVEEFLEEEGIKHEFSAPYTPQQNGVVERKNRTVIDMARTMLGEFKTPECFWSEAVNTACHAINRMKKTFERPQYAPWRLERCGHRNKMSEINLLPQLWYIPQLKTMNRFINRRRVIKGEHKMIM